MIRIALAFAKLAAAVLVFLAAVKLLRHLLGGVEQSMSGRELLRDQERGLRSAFRGLDHIIVNAGWLLDDRSADAAVVPLRAPDTCVSYSLRVAARSNACRGFRRRSRLLLRCRIGPQAGRGALFELPVLHSKN